MSLPQILWLRERFGWMGSYSGYDQVCETITELYSGNHISVWRNPGKPLPRGLGRLSFRLARGTKTSPWYSLDSAAAETVALWQCWRHHPEIVHINYLENNLGFLPQYKQRFSFKLIGTAHQPLSWWKLMHPFHETVAGLDALIVVSSKQVSYFDKFLPGRVYFIPHGVDINFFYPDIQSLEIKQNSHYPRFVFSGIWLRDLQTLAEVIDKVLFLNPNIRFDMIVPRSKRNDLVFFRIARHHQVFWHSDVSDEQLRQIYQNAAALVIPLLDSTANNAVLEAMACGLPIISNNIGGMTDYTHPSFADLFPIADTQGISQAILQLADSPDEQIKRGKLARFHAETNFSWKKVAEMTFEAYSAVKNQ